MKGKKLCFGLLLLSCIMVGLSLSVSSDASALRYELDYIPFWIPRTEANNSFKAYTGFVLSGDGHYLVNENTFAFPLEYSPELQSCYYDNTNIYSTYYNFRTRFDRYAISVVLPPTDDTATSQDVFNYLPYSSCNFPIPYPELQDSSLPRYLFGNPNLRSYLPYRFSYDGAYLKSTYTENGLNRKTRFAFSDVFQDGDVPDSFEIIDIPIGISTYSISNGSQLLFKGEFLIDTDDPASVFHFHSSTTTAELQVNALPTYRDYITHLPIASYSDTFTCTLTAEPNPNFDEAAYIVSYECPVSISTSYEGEFNLVGYQLHIQNDDDIWSLTNTTEVYYSSSYVITEGIDVPTPPFWPRFQKFDVQTSDENRVNSWAGYEPFPDVESDDVNWTSSLSNLFNFNFINPFVPMFSLFSDSSTCVSIPELASLINSPESTVCPWFPARVRNIMTPIFVLGSWMLVVGFVVHWLGSSSGNFFEDSAGETLTYSSWYGSGRGFKRQQGSNRRRIMK